MVASVYKWLSVSFIIVFFSHTYQKHSEPLFKEKGLHPFHVSTTEINHNSADKVLEITCRIFTDDFENILRKNYKTRVDLSSDKEKAGMDKLVSDYIIKHLQLRTNDKTVSLNYLGFEIDHEAVNSYLQVENIVSVKKIEAVNSLMYDMYEDQIGIMHVMVNGNRKSTKLDYPNTNAVFSF